MIHKRHSVSIQEAELSSDDPDPLGSLAQKNHFVFPSFFSFDALAFRPFKKIDSFPMNPSSRSFLQKHFPKATISDWNDWRWQIRNSITNAEQLALMLDLSDSEKEALFLQKSALPLRITPYYASLMNESQSDEALRRCMVPVASEYRVTSGESADPLGEDGHSPLPGLVHRYPDRVLFLVTEFCSAYCRYCTRSRLVGDHAKDSQKAQWEKALDYIESHPEIRDVLLSGGDPLTLSDDSLDYLLSRLRRIPHVQILRIGTKVPVVLPQRVTSGLVEVLKKHHPLFISIHFTHPKELTPETRTACARLADAGIPLGSQTVLLKGINDSVPVMTELVHGLLQARVRPYYLYQCDPILGSSHFRTSVEKGLEMIQGLRGHTSGYAVPHYVIDAPGGGGKIPLLPEYFVGRDENGVVLRNYEGRIFRYPDPESEQVVQN